MTCAMTQQPLSHQWMSRQRLMTYQRNKALGGRLIGAVFIGWLWLQWSNPVMRVVAICLTGLTIWMTTSSIVSDLRRAKGRALSLIGQSLYIARPDVDALTLPLESIARAHWRENSPQTLGLWLFDKNEQVLIHLDDHFLESQDEARAFLGWARKYADLNFQVTWEAPGIFDAPGSPPVNPREMMP